MKIKSQYKYILVEDSDSDARLFQILWQDVTQGSSLLRFSSGTDLFNYLLTQDKDTSHLFILDVNLPGMNGHECLAELRKLEMTRYSPIIMFSTSKADIDVNKSYLGQATSYVQKPNSLEETRRFIQSLVDFWGQVIPANHQVEMPGSTILGTSQHSPDISFLAQLLESLPNMVFVKEAKDLRFVYFNRAGETLLGLPRESLLGRNDYDFFPKSQADFFTQRDRTVLNSHHSLDIPREEIITQKKGLRQLRTRKVPLFLSVTSNEPSHLLGISEDITDSED